MISIPELDKRTNHIPSTVYENEHRLWLKYLGNLDTQGKYILDVGTGWGKSAASLALICPEASIQTIDWGDEYINGSRTKNEYVKQVNDYIRKAGVTNVYFQLKKYQEYKLKYPLIALNVDVTASYDCYKGAIDRFFDNLSNDGFLFVHSYIHPKTTGVQELMNDMVKKKQVEIIEVAEKVGINQGILSPAVFKKRVN